LKIKGKISGTIGILLTIILGLTLANSYFSEKNRESYQEMLADQEIRYLLKTIQYRVTGISNDERGYLMNGNKEFLKDIPNKAKEVSISFQQLTQLVGPEEKDKLAKIEDTFKKFYSASERAVQEMEAGNAQAAIDLHFKVERQARKALDEQMNEFITEVEQEVQSDLANSAASEVAREVGRYAVMGLSLLFGSIVGFLLYRAIVPPIMHMNRQMREIADGEGDLTRSITIAAKDEIGEMGQSFNRMMANLRVLLLQVRANAEQVAASSEQLTASAAQTGKASGQIATAITDVANGMEVQVKNVHSSSRTIQELIVNIRQIADNAQTASGTALHAVNLAAAGNQGVQSAVKQVSAVNQTMNGLANTVRGLGERSREIGEIVEVITAIAAQTNLLALNAAIESARAGEHGRGFAVVADEVRKLAVQSGESANQIAELISVIQTETGKAVEAMDMCQGEAARGIELVVEAGDIFANIHRSINEVAEQIQAVSAATIMMNEGTAQADQAITLIADSATAANSGTQEVSAATEEQLAAMEEISASAAELSRMAEELQKLIGRFTL